MYLVLTKLKAALILLLIGRVQNEESPLDGSHLQFVYKFSLSNPLLRKKI